jgi:hypothetical protein
MGAALGIGFLAFTLVYLYLMALRLRVGRLEDRIMAEVLSPRVGQPVEVLLEDGPAEAPGRDQPEDAEEVPARG